MATIELEVKSLSELRTAAAKLGLEFRENQKTYRYYGRWVGDYPLPEGISVEDLGKCDHALSIPGNDQAYEVGVVKRKDNKGFLLLWDFWSGGFGLKDKIGENGNKLKQRYAAEVAIKQARRQGFRVSERVQADGKIRLMCQR